MECCFAVRAEHVNQKFAHVNVAVTQLALQIGLSLIRDRQHEIAACQL